MTIRRDFLIHRRKTVESFQLVRTDISSINTNIEHIKNTLASMELKISTFDNEHIVLDRFQKNIEDFESKIDIINKSFEETKTGLNSLKEDIDNIMPENQDISSGLSKNSRSINKILSRIKTQTAKNRKLGSSVRKSQEEIDRLKKKVLKMSRFGTALRESQEGIKKLRNLLNRRLGTVKKTETELETKLKSQRKRSIQLNKKIELEKSAKKTKKRVPTKKIITSTKIKKTTIKPIKRIRKVIKEIKKSKKPKSTAKIVGLDKRIMTSRKETIEPNKEIIVEVKEEEVKK